MRSGDDKVVELGMTVWLRLMGAAPTNWGASMMNARRLARFPRGAIALDALTLAPKIC
jgi:hypothetical protein